MTAQNSPNASEPTQPPHSSHRQPPQKFATAFGGGLVLVVVGQLIAFLSFMTASPSMYSRSESGITIGGLIAVVGMFMVIYGAWGTVKHIDALAAKFLSEEATTPIA